MSRTARPPGHGASSAANAGLPIGLIGLLLLFSADLTAPPEWAVPASVSATAPAVAATARPTASVPIRVRSDFAAALNGWRFADRQPQSALEHSYGAGSDGARGFLRFRDGGGDGPAWLRMSSVHAGNQSDLYGGRIAFALRVYANGPLIGDSAPLLRISGRNGRTMTARHAGPSERGAWTEIAVDVLPGRWEIDGAPASQAGMRAILADVVTSELRIGQTLGGGAVVELDGVEFLGQYGTVDHVDVAAGS
jgi:hypothetical protein